MKPSKRNMPPSTKRRNKGKSSRTSLSKSEINGGVGRRNDGKRFRLSLLGFWGLRSFKDGLVISIICRNGEFGLVVSVKI